MLSACWMRSLVMTSPLFENGAFATTSAKLGDVYPSPLLRAPLLDNFRYRPQSPAGYCELLDVAVTPTTPFRMFSSKKENTSGSQILTPRWRKSWPSSTVWPIGG